MRVSEVSLTYDNPFWRFSTKLYRLSAVEKACLYLQEHQGVMVNQLLFSCWLTTQSRCYDTLWPQQVEPVLGWHNQFVVPLRRQRQQLKPMASVESHLQELREHLMEAELLAEQHEQALLYLLYQMKKGLAVCKNRGQALTANLCFTLKDTRLTATAQQELRQLLCAVADDDMIDDVLQALSAERAD